MEQRIGIRQLTALEGSGGLASFIAENDEAALAHITQHFVERLKPCARAELSSMQMVRDETADSGFRLIDDTHANPQFQETYVKYNAVTGVVECDWESTRTFLSTALPAFGGSPDSGTR